MREQKGITLIALVITIIVLLILAGVTIAMLSGENGILTRATTTKEANAESTAREQSNLAYMAVRTEIAAQKVKDGTYKPSEHGSELLTKVKADLQPTEATEPWNCTTTTGGIQMVFTDNSISNATHTLTYKITLTDTTATMDYVKTGTKANPSEGYKQIDQ